MSCLADKIVLLRCVRGRSGLRRMIGVVRRRSGPHFLGLQIIPEDCPRQAKLPIGLSCREASIGPRGVAIGDEIGTEVPA